MDPDKPLEGVRLLALQVIPLPEPPSWLLIKRILPVAGTCVRLTYLGLCFRLSSRQNRPLELFFLGTVQNSDLSEVMSVSKFRDKGRSQ